VALAHELPPEEPGPTPGGKKRPGRPVGSVSLTEEIADTIIGFIRAGTFDYTAAEAAGVSDRTLRDWIFRGEGRDPDRAPTPKLRAFASALRQARAQARAGAEIRVYQEQPLRWLTYAARTTPDRPGWTQSREVDDSPGHQLETLIARLDASDDPGRSD
jgi:hypothetical protein